MKQYAEIIGHDIHPSYGEILEQGVKNKQKCLFLESFQSTLELSAANERQYILGVKMPSVSALKREMTRTKRQLKNI